MVLLTSATCAALPLVGPQELLRYIAIIDVFGAATNSWLEYNALADKNSRYTVQLNSPAASLRQTRRVVSRRVTVFRARAGNDWEIEEFAIMVGQPRVYRKGFSRLYRQID